MNAYEILKQAREIISKPENWTQGCAARNTDGTAVEPDSPHAVCFCIYGAIDRVSSVNTSNEADQERHISIQILHNTTQAETGRQYIGEYNDTRTHEEVLALMDKAIEEAKQNEMPPV